ncbi:hypothetical protein Tco_1531193 [Tanacetum coccineum]
MANLEFCDKHNMVAYLEKSEGSKGFHEIIDFLSASHIHYALTTSPTIYTSLNEQFWQTGALCTIDDGVLGITTTIDRHVKITVSEGSIRRHLKLEDSEGIPSLLTVEIFEQLALIGYGEEPSIQTTPEISPSKITSSPSLSSHHTSIGAPSTSQLPITPTEEAALMPHESPLYSIYSLGRDEGSMQQHELMDLVTKLTDRIGVLEKDLQQTKKTYSTALIRLILRVKKLEKNDKIGKARRRARVVISEDEGATEDSSKQGKKIFDIDTDPTISLISIANIAVSTADAAVTTANASISTVSPPRVSTTKELVPLNKIKKMVQVQMSIDEELAKKVFEEEQARFNAEQEARFKAKQEQERIDFETALEFQKQLDEK